MSEQWFYARGGQQSGPVTFAQLSELARTGGLSANDLVWQEGTPDWRPAGQVPALFTAAPGPMMPPPPVAAGPYAPPPGQPAGAPPYGLPYGQPPANYYGPRSFENEARTAMIISIVGIFCFGIVLGPIGIVLGSKAKNNMRASGNMQGEGMATAAVVIGWIIVGLSALWLTFVIISVANS